MVTCHLHFLGLHKSLSRLGYDIPRESVTLTQRNMRPAKRIMRSGNKSRKHQLVVFLVLMTSGVLYWRHFQSLETLFNRGR